jgi:hypothetical protein
MSNNRDWKMSLEEKKEANMRPRPYREGTDEVPAKGKGKVPVKGNMGVASPPKALGSATPQTAKKLEEALLPVW